MSDFSADPVPVLIVDDLHPVFMEVLNQTRFSVHYKPDIRYESVLSIIDQYEVLILRSKFRVNKELLERASRLKLIGRAGAGVDNIDKEFAKKHRVTLVSAPEGNCDAVAEHMIGMLLNLMNRICRGNSQIRHHIWDREGNRAIELGGKTVGLIGYGNNGKAMARKLAGFGVTVLAYDKYLENYSDEFATQSSLSTIQKEADILSLHIPLTAETEKWVDRHFFESFLKPFFFLNGSRGAIVQIEALLESLRSGRVLGAGLDVLPVEKFPALGEASWYQPLLGLDHVILTPHVAGWSFESYEKISAFLAKKINTHFGAE